MPQWHTHNTNFSYCVWYPLLINVFVLSITITVTLSRHRNDVDAADYRTHVCSLYSLRILSIDYSLYFTLFATLDGGSEVSLAESTLMKRNNNPAATWQLYFQDSYIINNHLDNILMLYTMVQYSTRQQRVKLELCYAWIAFCDNAIATKLICSRLLNENLLRSSSFQHSGYEK